MIEIFPEFQEGLDGLQALSHIYALRFLDRLKPEQVGVLNPAE